MVECQGRPRVPQSIPQIWSCPADQTGVAGGYCLVPPHGLLTPLLSSLPAAGKEVANETRLTLHADYSSARIAFSEKQNASV